MIDSNLAPTGVGHGEALREFADAILSRVPADIAQSRQALVDCTSEAAMVDATAVVGNFQRMVRIADGTGIPLDEPVLMMSQSIREDLGINEFNAAKNSPGLSFVKRMMGRVLAPFAPALLKRIAAGRSGD